MRLNMHIKNSEIGMINLCFEIFDDRIKIVISDQGEVLIMKPQNHI